MAFNFSRLENSWCIFVADSNATSSISGYYTVSLTVCVVTSLLAPITVDSNALILAAIWKNPTLRTPCYVLLAGLAFTDFCSGLLSQPSYVVYKLAEVAGQRKLICIAGVITQISGYYFSSLTVITLTIIAVERWLHMSRRSLLTVRRVLVLNVTFILFFNFASRLVSFNQILETIYYCVRFMCSTLFLHHCLRLLQGVPNHTSPSKSRTNKSERH